MATVRRLYVYILVLVSVEIMIWGTIILVRNLFGGGVTTSDLAGSLAFILVSIPVFGLHWYLAQRGTKNTEERFSGVRAVFFYAVLAGTLVPVLQNTLALANRFFLWIMRLPLTQAQVGGDQSWLDNLVAIAVNLVFAWYFYRLLKQDWKDRPPGSSLPVTRRIYRYLWVSYGLGLLVLGMQQVLETLLKLLAAPGFGSRSAGVDLGFGIALALVGAALWAWTWQLIQQSLTHAEERFSQLRLVILYVLTLGGVAGVLVPLGSVIYQTLFAWLSRELSWAAWVGDNSPGLATLVVFAVVWRYFGGVRVAEVAAIPDHPRRAGLLRLYRYILALAGLAATVAGVESVGEYLVAQLFGNALTLPSMASQQLAGGLAAIIVGLPLWALTWPVEAGMAREAGENGDHARRSVVRKVYLYIALFAGVIGVMLSAGRVFYLLLMNILGAGEAGAGVEIAQMVKTCVIFGCILLYHFYNLRGDGRMAAQALLEKHRAFSVLILEPGDGTFSRAMATAIHVQTPELPVAVHLAAQGVPGEDFSMPRSVVLPASLAVDPGEALRLWLQQLDVPRVVVPLPGKEWIWLGGLGKPLVDLAAEAARTVQQLAEGEEIRPRSRIPAWVIVLAIIGGFGLGMIILSLFISLLQSF